MFDREALIDEIILHNDKNICGFFRDFRFLSNMYPVTITYQNITYPSTENAYQAHKFNEIETREFIATLSPSKSKIYANDNKKKWRKDFDSFKVNLMIELNRLKYATEPFYSALIDTEDKYLEETNYWKDSFWGVFEGVGNNTLGKIIMDIRNELNNSPTIYNLYKPIGIDLSDLINEDNDEEDEADFYF
jgi:ribA/ribD-fused uncharacterized protein